jgi:hypothetical protein
MKRDATDKSDYQQILSEQKTESKEGIGLREEIEARVEETKNSKEENKLLILPKQ